MLVFGHVDQSSESPIHPAECDDSDELSIMCAGLEKSPEHEDDRRRSSGSHYSISSSSFGLLYSSSSPSSPSTSSVSPLLRSRSPSDSSQGPPTPPGAIPHHFAFPLVSLTQAAGETVIAKRPELYERSSMDSIASWDGTPWNSMFGYREECSRSFPALLMTSGSTTAFFRSTSHPTRLSRAIHMTLRRTCFRLSLPPSYHPLPELRQRQERKGTFCDAVREGGH